MLLIAPHPDDETLACGVVLQRAVKAGAAIRIIYATDGDNNPWPQRMIQRKWRIAPSDRAKWGRLRRRETLAALKVFGVKAGNVEFLALPDQGLTNLLCRNCRTVVEFFAKAIREWSPTHVLVPTICDIHPDHSALAVLLRLALMDEFAQPFSVTSYLVHGKSASFATCCRPIVQTAVETAAKLDAILCHRTQITLSRKRFVRYANRSERFAEVPQCELSEPEGAIRLVTRTQNSLQVKFVLGLTLSVRNEARLLVLGIDADRAPRCFQVALPSRSGRVQMTNCRLDARLFAAYDGNAFAGEFRISMDHFRSTDAVFVKLERRGFFFDDAGWLEVPPALSARPAAVSATELSLGRR